MPLKTGGYEVHCPQLPSVGSTQAGFEPDVAIISNTIESLVAKDKDVILMCHSFGGMVGSAAASPFLKRKGDSGHGVVAMIYMCAFLPAKGQSLSDLGSSRGWAEPNDQGQVVIIPEKAQAALYNDVTDQKLVDDTIAELKPQSEGAFKSVADAEPWREVRTVYILCELDQALVLQQEVMSGRGGMIEQVTLKAGHSPWMSDLDNLLKIVVTVAEGRKLD
ncbi:hypothetical protein MBLNU457_g2442t1 [Dothideomycetes sp. NU457]